MTNNEWRIENDANISFFKETLSGHALNDTEHSARFDSKFRVEPSLHTYRLTVLASA